MHEICNVTYYNELVYIYMFVSIARDHLCALYFTAESVGLPEL